MRGRRLLWGGISWMLLRVLFKRCSASFCFLFTSLTNPLSPQLRAFEKLLQDYPEWIGNVVMIQVTSPALTDSAKLERMVSEIVAHINEEFGFHSCASLVSLFSFIFSCLPSPYSLFLPIINKGYKNEIWRLLVSLCKKIRNTFVPLGFQRVAG